MSTDAGTNERLMRLEEHQLFLERQIEELSGEVIRLGDTVRSLQKALDGERQRIAQLTNAIQKQDDSQGELPPP